MTTVHRVLGGAIVMALVVIMLWAVVLLARRADETPAGLRVLQHWTENLLLLQTVGGIVLLVLGRRVTGPSDA